ncbi:MAG TPA: hypothetical protein VGF25_19750 [Thermoleophilaceae bacterium]|jgi:hypothetical protein
MAKAARPTRIVRDTCEFCGVGLRVGAGGRSFAIKEYGGTSPRRPRVVECCGDCLEDCQARWEAEGRAQIQMLDASYALTPRQTGATWGEDDGSGVP